MNLAAKLVSMAALGAMIVPCVLFFGGMLELDAVKWAALAGTIFWFAATPIWMSRELPKDASHVEI